MNDEPNVSVNTDPVHELVGCLSEGLLMCSYNEDEIREIWKEGRLNAEIHERLDTLDKRRFDDLLRGWVVQNDDYQSLLTQKVKEAGGWPVDWSSAPEDLAPLGKKERVLCGLD